MKTDFRFGGSIRTCVPRLPFGLALLLTVGAVPVFPASLNGPDTMCSGQTAKFTVKGSNSLITWGAVDPTIASLKSIVHGAEVTAHAAGTPITITATVDNTTLVHSVDINDCPGSNEVIRAIAGIEQSGASSSDSQQDFVLDMFVSRPLLSATSRLRLWGDVKVASFPQTFDTSLVTLTPEFAKTFGDLKANKLFESAEFVVGPEFLLGNINDAGPHLSFFAGVGATGPNSNPLESATVFMVPATGTPQWSAFNAQFPGVITKYVAFLPEDRERFLRQWQAGTRLYWSYGSAANAAGKLPATVDISFGKNELVTGGRLKGVVGRVAAMMPMVLGGADQPVVYFFGEATLGFKRSTAVTPIALAPALDDKSNPISLTDPGVTTVTVPGNRRDTYRLGVGIELISLFNQLNTKSK